MADFGKDDPIADNQTPSTQRPVVRSGTVTFGADDIVTPSATLGEGAPTTEMASQQQEQARLAQEALARFQALSPRRQFTTGARHVLASTPFLRSLVDVTDDQDVADMRTGLPGVSRGFGMAAQSIPYAGIGAGLPALMSTLPRAAVTSATIQGGDAAFAGEPITPAAVGGAIGAVPGYALGRAITPRNPQSAFDVRMGRAIDLSNLWRTRPRTWEADARNTTVMRDYLGKREADDFLGLPQGLPAQIAPTIPRIPPSGNIGLGGLGTYIGHQMGGGDILTALLGAGAAPLAANVARGAANAGIRRVNEALRETAPGRAIGGALQGYSTNQSLSPANRALLQALSGPIVTPTLEAGAQALTGSDVSTEALLSALLAAPSTVHDTLLGQ